MLFFDAKHKNGKVHTKGIWIYDLRTNKHFTLKTRQLSDGDLKDFIECYNPDNRHERKESERFKYYKYDELIARDKASLDIFWLKDDSLDNLEDLPAPTFWRRKLLSIWKQHLRHFVMWQRGYNCNAGKP